MSWLKEYKNSLKNIHTEEPLDIYFFRPLAFVIVKLFYSLPITPNQYSLASLLAGVASGYFFLQGTSKNYNWGAWFFLLAAVFDCCDGMLARLKKNGTEFGRLIDGVIDYLVNLTVYIALTINFYMSFKDQLFLNVFAPWFLIAWAGISKALHAIFYDHYLAEYLSYEKGEDGFLKKEIAGLKNKINEIQKFKRASLKVAILKIYLAYSLLQAGKEDRALLFDPKDYCQKNYWLLRLWSLIGPSVHIFVLIIAFIFNSPYLLFYYAIVFGNLWLLVMVWYQARINRQLSAGILKK